MTLQSTAHDRADHRGTREGAELAREQSDPARVLPGPHNEETQIELDRLNLLACTEMNEAIRYGWILQQFIAVQEWCDWATGKYDETAQGLAPPNYSDNQKALIRRARLALGPLIAAGKAAQERHEAEAGRYSDLRETVWEERR
jgi:hypothetical protein